MERSEACLIAGLDMGLGCPCLSDEVMIIVFPYGAWFLFCVFFFVFFFFITEHTQVTPGLPMLQS